MRRTIDRALASAHRLAGERVRYVCERGEICLTAVRGATVFEQTNEFGVNRWESRDFLFRADVLVIAGQQVTPQAGDKIVTECGAEHRVLSEGGAACFRHDASGAQIRIHTKRLDT
jgi:hypothetical protein